MHLLHICSVLGATCNHCLPDQSSVWCLYSFVCVAAAIGTCFVSVASLPHESGNGETMMNALSLSFPIWCDPRASLLENEPLDTLKIGN